MNAATSTAVAVATIAGYTYRTSTMAVDARRAFATAATGA